MREAKETNKFIDENLKGTSLYEGGILEGDALKMRIIEARAREQAEAHNRKMYLEERQKIIDNTMQKIEDAKEADNKVTELKKNINKMEP